MKAIIFLLFAFSICTLNTQAQSSNSRHSGIYNITEIGYLQANNNDVKYAARLRTIFGYFITPKISAGIGLGFDGYHDPADINTAPLFLDLRGYLKDEPQTIFAYLNLGQSIKIADAHEKGFFMGLGLGYQRKKIIGSIGYNLQKIDLIESSISISSIAFNLGLLF